MNKIEKIKTEIDRLQSSMLDENSNFKSQYDQGIFDGLSLLENFIDFLEEEPVSNDLEEAAMQYAKSKHKDTTLQQIVSWDFKAGAEWQKEKMMEDAVDGEIYFNLDYLQYHINTEPLAHFHHGDKVKLIIVKEE